MRKFVMWSLPLFLLALGLPLSAVAQGNGSQSSMAQDGNAETGYASGTQVNRWVDLQISGTEAVKDTPSVSGDVASHIYNRYVDSFSHAIPDHFSRQTFSKGGGSGR